MAKTYGFLDKDIKRIMAAYSTTVYEIVEEEAIKAAKGCAAKLRQVSPKRTDSEKSYAKGWTVAKLTRDRIPTVHNRTKPGLAHLLEYGHQGRSPAPAYQHIYPVSEEYTDAFVDAVLERLNKEFE